MDIIHKISVDFGREQIPPHISVMQKDTARKIEASLYENGAIWDVPVGASAYIAFKSPSGKNIRLLNLDDGKAIVSYSGNIATVVIPPQLTEISGNVPLVVVFVDGDGSQVATFPIAVSVGSSPVDQSEESETISTDEFTQLLSEIALNRARINNISTLKEGSTTGDAELMDIRVGYDGKQYANAGEAVRGQVGQLSSEIIAGKKLSLAAKENGYHNNYNCLELWESGAIDSTGPVANNTRMRIKTYLDKNITVIDIDENYSFMVYRYNNDVVDTSYYTGWIKTITLDQAQYDYKVFVKKDDNTGIGDNIISHYSAVNLLGLPIYEKKEFVIDKSGNGDFTSLVKGLRKAYAYKDATFYVNSGVYDLIQEFKEEYGDDFFTNFTTESIRGIVLLNHCKVIFSPNATVNCNYDGDNEIVMQYFAPFNSGEGGFEIYGLQLYASRVRYCFHDELGSNTVPYVSKYRNCYMKLDNTGNTAWSADQCIGGGLGKSALIDISGCIFESVRVGNDLSAVSYHNSAVTNAKSQIIIEGNYISGNKTIRLSWYGDSTSITNAIVSNNNVGSEIIYRAESTEAANRNISLLAWNNVVRNTGT